jgi:2-C-methyl-D-erythritol 2,4-cyclodiphosphate synthase
MRIGHGFDVHALVTGRKLIIGGVEISHDKGLLGHSDADVLLHAIADALLGAAGLPDIGQQFPPSDERYRGADSLKLLESVVQMVRQAGFPVIENIDAIIMAEAPKMNPHIPAMKQNIARALRIDSSCVGLKATTTEKLGFVGREEGIAASAVCLLDTNE